MASRSRFSSGQDALSFRNVLFNQRAHAVPVFGQISAAQGRQDLQDVLRLGLTHLRKRLDALPGCNRLFIRNVREKIRDDGIKTVLLVPPRIGCENVQRPVSDQGFRMTEQRGNVIEIRVPGSGSNEPYNEGGGTVNRTHSCIHPDTENTAVDCALDP